MVKWLKKIVVGNIVIALMLFAGGFCVHPMEAQAVSMDKASSVEHTVSENDMQQGIQVDSAAMPMINTCIFDCISKAPQAEAIKKTNSNTALNVFTHTSQAETFQISEYSPDPLEAIGTAPPAPDILSSIMKKE